MFRKVELPYKHDIGPFEDVLKNKKSTFQKKRIGGGGKNGNSQILGKILMGKTFTRRIFSPGSWFWLFFEV